MRHEEKTVPYFKTNGTWLVLFPKESLATEANVLLLGTGSPGFTLAHNVHIKEEVDSLISHAVSVGETLGEPAQNPEWGRYSGYFSDPDGYLWEVYWNPFFWIE